MEGDGEDDLRGVELVRAVNMMPGRGVYNDGSVGERSPTPKMYKKFNEDGIAQVVWKYTHKAHSSTCELINSYLSRTRLDEQEVSDIAACRGFQPD